MRMRALMRVVSCASVLAASAAAWGQPTLTFLNSGPSSSAIPSGDDSTVLTFAFPREVANPLITAVPSGVLDGTAGPNSSLTVQTAGGGGFRNRSRATSGESSQTNVNTAIRLIGNTNGDGRAANSFVFIGRSVDVGTGVGQIGNSIASLLAFIGTHTEGTAYFQIPFSAYPSLNTDAEIAEARLNSGVSVSGVELWSADPDGGGPLTANSYRFNASYDIALVAMDTGGSSDPDVVTEFMYLSHIGLGVVAARAMLDVDPGMVSAIRVTANRQLVDDLSTGAVGNPADTNPDTLLASRDIRVALNADGTNSQPLSQFLAGLPGAPAVTSFSVSGTGQAGFNRLLTCHISPEMTDPAAIATIRGSFLGLTSGLQGAEVFAVHGGRAVTAAYVRITASGRLEIEADSCPWLAAALAGGLCGNAAPQNSPPLATGVALVAGTHLAFDAEGAVRLHIDDPLISAADGNPSLLRSFTCGGASLRGLSNIQAPAGALVGVFLGSDDPASTPAPADLDFASTIARDFLALDPLLKQVFFIGDGKASGGVAQRFRVPPGATRLFLGVMDGLDWTDNLGLFSVDVVVSPCPGDATGDNVVDFRDLSLVLAFYGRGVTPGHLGDVNGDGVVDALDLNLVLATYGIPC